MTEDTEVLANEPAVPEINPEGPQKRPGFFYRREGRIFAITALSILAAVSILFGFFYIKFARMIDTRLAEGPFSNTINVLTAPRTVAVGDAVTLDEAVARLRRAGYTTARG